MNDLQEKLRAVKQVFLARTREEYTTLRRHQQMRDLPRDELRRIIHRLSGSAGFFGYPDIGRMAGLIDEELADGAADDQIDLPRLLAALGEIVDRDLAS